MRESERRREKKMWFDKVPRTVGVATDENGHLIRTCCGNNFSMAQAIVDDSGEFNQKEMEEDPTVVGTFGWCCKLHVDVVRCYGHGLDGAQAYIEGLPFKVCVEGKEPTEVIHGFAGKLAESLAEFVNGKIAEWKQEQKERGEGHGGTGTETEARS